MAGNLLFIVKTQDSECLSRSQAREKSRILSHVQWKRRKAESDQKQSNQPWAKYLNVLEGPGVKDLDLNEKQQPATGHITRKKQAIRQRKPSILKSAHPTRPLACPVRMPVTYPIHNVSDPFHCTAVGLDAGPSSVCSQRFSSRHQAIHAERLNHCVDDAALMYTTLAYGSSFLSWAMGGMSDKERSPEYYMDRALREVRKRLSTSNGTPNNWLALSIYALAATEFWNGLPAMWKGVPEKYETAQKTYSQGLAACRIHLKALLHVATEAGGWHLFDPYVFESAVLMDKFLSVCSRQPGVMPLTRDPGAVTNEMGAGLGFELCSALPRLGSQLLRKPMESRLFCVIKDIVDYARFAHVAWLKPNVDTGMETWLFRRFQALQYRLMLLLLAKELTLVDKCICTSALIFLLTNGRNGGPQMGAQYLVKHLRSLLASESRFSDGELLEEDLWEWFLCTGAMVVGELSERSWFLERLAEDYPGKTLTEERLQTVLESYLYIPVRQDGQLMAMVGAPLGLVHG